MNEYFHTAVSALLQHELSGHIVNGTCVILGLYHQSPAIRLGLMPLIMQAFGPRAEGTTEHIGEQFTAIARRITAGELHEDTEGLMGVGHIMQVNFATGPVHLLTMACTDQVVHRIGWDYDEAEPRPAIFLPGGGVDMSTDPLASPMASILAALTGGRDA